MITVGQCIGCDRVGQIEKTGERDGKPFGLCAGCWCVEQVLKEDEAE